MSDDQPVIEQRENGPLVVKNLKTFEMPDGTATEAKPVIALCRCGASKNKPYCDGSHTDAGFESACADVASKDRIYTYDGRNATVHFNKLLCSHAGECGKRALDIFNPKQKPWVQPDAGPLAKIEEVVKACPSGALRYSLPDQEPETTAENDPAITIEPNGPYRVSNVPIDAAYWGEGQTPHKYVLCRCGRSQNKPFCDGTHYDEGWKENG